MSNQSAEAIFTAVSAGKTLFMKTPAGGWQIIGPAADIKVGGSVIVAKADGTTKRVIVVEVRMSKTVRGISYSTAVFDDYPETFGTYRRDTYRAGRCESCGEFFDRSGRCEGCGVHQK